MKAARKLEMEYFDAKQEAPAKTGKAPITVRWVDTNKGDDDDTNYRSRLVAMENQATRGAPHLCADAAIGESADCGLVGCQ